MTPTEEHLAFFHELGLTITQWAMVETNLRRLASTCFSQQDRKNLSIGFLSVENFRSKLKFTNNLLEAKFKDSSEFPEWKKIYEKLERVSKRRNELAHRSVVLYLNGQAGRRYALIDDLSEQKNLAKVSPAPEIKTKPPTGAICLVNLVETRLEFVALSIRLQNFHSRLIGEEPFFPEEMEYPSKTPTVSDIRKQLKQILGSISAAKTK